MVFEVVITIYDVMGIPIYTGEFIEPNILVLNLIEYRSGYSKSLMQKIIELLTENLSHNGIFHIIKVFDESFYNSELLTEEDYNSVSDEFIYLKEHWQRICDIDVIPHETLAYKINLQISRVFKGDKTVTMNTKTFDEALEIVKDYNIKHNIK